MAWTAPRTWVADEIVTAALMNTHVRDNLLETMTAKVTTAGDTAYATAANALARLGIGAAHELLRTNSGATAPEWVALSTLAPHKQLKPSNVALNDSSWDVMKDVPGSSFTFTAPKAGTLWGWYRAVNNVVGGQAANTRLVLDGTNGHTWTGSTGADDIQNGLFAKDVSLGSRTGKLQTQRSGADNPNLQDIVIAFIFLPD